MASRITARYPKEFPNATADAALIDYMRIECIEKNYSASNTSDRNNKSSVSYYNDSGFYDLVDLGGNVPNTVVMYMPQKITESIAQSWSQTSLQPTVGKALRGGANAGDLFKNLAEKSILDLAIKNLPKVGASVTESAILSSTAGIIYNPMVEVLYDGPQYRTFNYSFTLFAKSEQDAAEIYKIVRFFQYASVPSYSTTNINFDGLKKLLNTSLDTASIIQGLQTGTDLAKEGIQILIGKKTGGNVSDTAGKLIGDVANAGFAGLGTLFTSGAINSIGGITDGLFSGERFIKQPPLLKINYMRGPNPHPYITSLKPCIIQSLDVDYTPTGSYTILDNFGKTQLATVVATNISLNLAEVKTVYREDYSSGFLSSSSNTYFTDQKFRNSTLQEPQKQTDVIGGRYDNDWFGPIGGALD